MSDDEYYEEYDEFNEMLYDADPGPDLADDLAEHAMHSPLWQDNPTEELRDYFSDWEYYSDDYFDDDPKLLLGTSNNIKSTTRQVSQTPKRGRKRKLSEAKDSSQLGRKEVDALAASLRGTVWKSRSPEPRELFKLGIETPVALKLSTEIMKAAYSRDRGFGKGRLSQDESWAKDMSLVDMGLTTSRNVGLHDQEVGDTGTDAEDSGEGELGDEGEQEAGHQSDELLNQQEMLEEALEGEAVVQDAEIVHVQVDTETHSRKRQRLNDTAEEAEKAVLPTPDASLDSEETDDRDRIAHSPKRRRSRPTKTDTPNPEKEQPDANPQIANQRGRKRKLSVSDHAATASTASSRAKRAAVEKPVTKSSATGRSLRSRKK